MKLNGIRQAGFTLLEALIALLLSSLVLLLLASGILEASKIKEILVNDSQAEATQSHTVSGDRQLEWHLFLNQLETYLEGTKNPQVFKEQILLDEWEEETNRYVVTRYDQRGSRNNFVRSKSNGYNRMLTGIQTVHLKKEEGWLLLDFTFRNGENYQGKVWVNSWTEETEENH